MGRRRVRNRRDRKRRDKGDSDGGQITVRVPPTRFRLPEKTYTMHRNGREITVHRPAQTVDRKGYTYTREDVGKPGRGRDVVPPMERARAPRSASGNHGNHRLRYNREKRENPRKEEEARGEG